MNKNRFQCNGDGIVIDTQTKLIWQRSDDGQWRNWEAAVDYAMNLRVDEYCQWRLPTIEELSELIDFSRSKPSIDPIFSCRQGGYWSSSMDVSGNVWAANLYRGQVGMGSKTQLGYVLCVHQSESEGEKKE